MNSTSFFFPKSERDIANIQNLSRLYRRTFYSEALMRHLPACSCESISVEDHWCMRSHGLFRSLLAASERALCQSSACLAQHDLKAVFSVDDEGPHASNAHGADSRLPQSASLGLGRHLRRRLSSHASSMQQGKPPHSVDIRIGDVVDVRLESGSMALQADGACLASSGSTHVLATAVCDSSVVVEDDEDILPLQVLT